MLKREFDYTLIKTGEKFTVEVEINFDGIARMLASRAIHNKSQKCTAMQGEIVCKVISRESHD